PLMTSPASGLIASESCSAAYSSSERYSSIRCVNSLVSTKVYTRRIIRLRRSTAKPDRECGEQHRTQRSGEESRIMPVAGGGFDQCYNAQAAVAADSLLIVTMI